MCHSELCRLLSGSYSKIHFSSSIIICLKINFVIFYAFRKVHADIPSVFLLFIGDNFWDQLGTKFLHAQFEGQNFVDGLAVQIRHTADHSVKRRSDRKRSLTLVTFSSVFEVQVLSERGSSFTISRPFKNAFAT